MVRSWSVGVPAGVALLAALLLTGCAPGEPGNDDAAAPSSPGSSSPAPTSSSEEGSAATTDEYVPASLEGPARNVPEPVLPALAKEESLEGAQAFLDYWSDAMWFAYQTGDTSYARAIISPHCEACLEELDAVESVYIDDLWMTGGRPSIRLTVDELIQAQDGVYKPLAKYSGEGGKLIDNGVLIEEKAPTSNESTLVYLDFDKPGWVYITMAPVAGE